MEDSEERFNKMERESDRANALDDDNEERKARKSMTANQEILIKKLLKSKKFKDDEYRELRNVVDNKVQTSYDASVLINYLLSTLNYRRHYFNGKHKAYKKCFFCASRDDVKRYFSVVENKKWWVCDFCAINLDPEKVVPVKEIPISENPVNHFRKERAEQLTSAQEDLICEHREE